VYQRDFLTVHQCPWDTPVLIIVEITTKPLIHI
jgi:hypothetical protein